MKGSTELGIANPMQGIGQQQLIKMYKTNTQANIVTKIGSQTISDTAVLKKGTTESWGYDHIFTYIRPDQTTTRAQQIKEAFNLPNADQAVLDLIEEGLEKGSKDAVYPYIINYTKNNEILKIVTGIDSDKIGSIITLSFG